MLASKIVADLERELEAVKAENLSLKVILAAQGLEPADPGPWYGAHLPPRQRLIMDLLRSYPDRVFTRREINRALPMSVHAQGSDDAVDVHVCKIRKRLGRDAIDTIGGEGSSPMQGYRLGAKYRRQDQSAA